MEQNEVRLEIPTVGLFNIWRLVKEEELAKENKKKVRIHYQWGKRETKREWFTKAREEEGVVNWQTLLKGQLRFGKRKDMNTSSFRGAPWKEECLIEGGLKKELQEVWIWGSRDIRVCRQLFDMLGCEGSRKIKGQQEDDEWPK